MEASGASVLSSSVVLEVELLPELCGRLVLVDGRRDVGMVDAVEEEVDVEAFGLAALVLF